MRPAQPRAETLRSGSACPGCRRRSTIRRQLAPRGVRVGAVLPGPVVTALLDDWPKAKMDEALAMYREAPMDFAIGGGSVPGGMDHLVAAIVMQRRGLQREIVDGVLGARRFPVRWWPLRARRCDAEPHGRHL